LRVNKEVHAAALRKRLKFAGAIQSDKRVLSLLGRRTSRAAGEKERRETYGGYAGGAASGYAGRVKKLLHHIFNSSVFQKLEAVSKRA
jgi:hypothetical protein